MGREARCGWPKQSKSIEPPPPQTNHNRVREIGNNQQLTQGVLLDPCILLGIVYYPDPERLNFFPTKLGSSWLLWMQDNYSAVG